MDYQGISSCLLPTLSASQRQYRPSELPSPLVFFMIDPASISTATPGIPLASSGLKLDSFHRHSRVEPWTFTADLSNPLHGGSRRNDSGQRLPPTYYRGCWHVVAGAPRRYRHSVWLFTRLTSSQLKAAPQPPKPSSPTRRLPGEGFRALRKIPPAASRRSLGRVSVPVWLIVLSDQLRIVALVSRYLTDKLIRRGPISMRRPKLAFPSSLMAGGHIWY